MQAAEKATGRLKVVYRHCEEVLEHLNNKNTGSSGMVNHLEQIACKKATRRGGETTLKQQEKLKVR